MSLRYISFIFENICTIFHAKSSKAFHYIPIHCRLEYDEKTDRAKNAKGVTTRVPDFGNTTAIEWLDPYLHGPASYFYPFVDSLCRLLGYERGKSLRAAPYDFRYDPCKLQKNSACTWKNLVSIYLLLILEPFVPIPVIENKKFRFS